MDSPEPRHILVIGSGTFGLSLAHHLSQFPSSYRVTVLERASHHLYQDGGPTSKLAERAGATFSAGNDMNKVLRAEYRDSFYSELAFEAMKAWDDPSTPYAGCAQKTGWVASHTPLASDDMKAKFVSARNNATAVPGYAAGGGKTVDFHSREELKIFLPRGFIRDDDDAQMKDWTSYYNSEAGFAYAARALMSVYDDLRDKENVRFISGERDGQVDDLIYSKESGPERKCVGARTVDGKQHLADLTVLAMGAGVSCLPSIAPLLEQENHASAARGVGIAHLRLTDAEVAERGLQDMPIMVCWDIGYLFPPLKMPSGDEWLLKIASMNCGYVNFVDSPTGKGSRVSLPTHLTNPEARNDKIPKRDEAEIRRLVGLVFGDDWGRRELVGKKLCWHVNDPRSGEQYNGNYLISYVPLGGRSDSKSMTESGLFIASADCGHGFKMMPLIGREITDVIEGRYREGSRERWEWKWRQQGEGTEDQFNWPDIKDQAMI